MLSDPQWIQGKDVYGYGVVADRSSDELLTKFRCETVRAVPARDSCKAERNWNQTTVLNSRVCSVERKAETSKGQIMANPDDVSLCSLPIIVPVAHHCFLNFFFCSFRVISTVVYTASPDDALLVFQHDFYIYAVYCVCQKNGLVI